LKDFQELLSLFKLIKFIPKLFSDIPNVFHKNKDVSGILILFDMDILFFDIFISKDDI